MPAITYKQAISQAMRDALAVDPKTFIMGQDVGITSMSGLTAGFGDEFGLDRVRDCPISESAMIGIGAGAAMKGYTAIVEIAYADILAVAFSSIVHSAAKLNYASNGQLKCPLVVVAPIGRFSRHGPMGTDVAASWFYNVPDLNIVMPASPAEAYWGFAWAVKDPKPTIYLEDRSLYPAQGEIGERLDTQRARVTRGGTEITVIVAGRTVALAEQAADQIGGGRVEVLSLGVVKPLDSATVTERARRTGRVLVVHDEPPNGGYGPVIQSVLCGLPAGALKCPPRLVSRADQFLPYRREEDHLPTAAHIVAAINDMLK
jgi:pyruvate dehydrogenase E1 component beta subunit